MVGVGFTVIVKFEILPVQDTPAFKKVGVMDIVPLIDVVPELVVRKGEIVPVPEIPRPIEGLLFIHE